MQTEGSKMRVWCSVMLAMLAFPPLLRAETVELGRALREAVTARPQAVAARHQADAARAAVDEAASRYLPRATLSENLSYNFV